MKGSSGFPSSTDIIFKFGIGGRQQTYVNNYTRVIHLRPLGVGEEN